MRQVLVTGGCGFIGRHVTHELCRQGYAVRVLDNLLEQVHGDAAGVAPGADVDLIRADIRDKQAVAAALDGVDAVIHLAAEVGVGQSMYEIARYVGVNDLGTAVLLEVLIKQPVQRIVVASSMSVYGEGSYLTADGGRRDSIRRKPEQVRAGLWEPQVGGETLTAAATDEEKQVDLASIYALTKYAQERAVMLFGEAYGVGAVALRLFNVFGAGQALSNPYTGVLANFASRLANRQPPIIFEDGRQRRDFVHVRDVARAFRLALEQPQAAGHVINIGSGQSYTIEQVATLLARAMGVPEIAPEITGKVRAGDIRNCFADISKARELLGFSPEHRLETSLDEFVRWVRGTSAIDRGAQMKRELEEMGLVS